MNWHFLFQYDIDICLISELHFFWGNLPKKRTSQTDIMFIYVHFSPFDNNFRWKGHMYKMHCDYKYMYVVLQYYTKWVIYVFECDKIILWQSSPAEIFREDNKVLEIFRESSRVIQRTQQHWEFLCIALVALWFATRLILRPLVPFPGLLLLLLFSLFLLLVCHQAQPAPTRPIS